MITGEVEAVDRKQKIRDRYKGVDISELEVINQRKTTMIGHSTGRRITIENGRVLTEM